MEKIQSFQITDMTIAGFKSYVEPTNLVFGNPTVITGGNGRGKTSIADAIAFVVTGLPFFGERGIDRLHNEVQPDVSITMSFVEETYFHPDQKPKAEATSTEETGLTIAIPLENVNIGNLTKLLDAKGFLIKRALHIDDLRFELNGDSISFPWFSELPESDEVHAYSTLIAAICKMSKDQKRISATEKTVDNERYAFRCFLLRLGFIGDEYKADRKILMRYLPGNSAFKGGDGHAISK